MKEVSISLALLASGCLGSGGSTAGGSATGGSTTSGGSTTGGSSTGGQTSGRSSCPYGGEPPCQFVVAPSALNFADVPVGETSQVLTFEIQNVGVDICLIGPIELANGFSLVSMSIQPDPTTDKITIPAPGQGIVSSLTIELDLTCTVAGPVSTEFLCSTLTGTCG